MSARNNIAIIKDSERDATFCCGMPAKKFAINPMRFGQH